MKQSLAAAVSRNIQENASKHLPKKHLYLIVYENLSHAIRHDLLKPGERVPSIRVLASELGVALGTVESAYALLIGEGYLEARGQAGTFVQLNFPTGSGVANHNLNHSKQCHNPMISPAISNRISQSLLLRMGVPALDAFPKKIWSRLAMRQVRMMSLDSMSYPDPQGALILRQSIASYLATSRGIHCDASQIFITPGYLGAIALIAKTLLTPEDQVWVEDPSYLPPRELLRTLGMSITPIPVDQEGMQIEQALVSAPMARLALVTPAHQSPLGMTLSHVRRQQLLAWANTHNTWIIEADYDGEYHYDAPPLPALKSFEEAQRVLYVGTFSKTLFPGLRMAYLVVPQEEVTNFRVTKALFQEDYPVLFQLIAADFIRAGYFFKHLKKMRTLYAKRRTLLINALQKAICEYSVIKPEIEVYAGGMSLLLRFDASIDDKYIVEYAKKEGLMVEALSSWSITGGQSGLLMGFTNIATSQLATKCAEALCKLF